MTRLLSALLWPFEMMLAGVIVLGIWALTPGEKKR